MTKEQLAKLGIVIEEDTIDDAKALELIAKKQNEKDAELKKHKDLLSARNGEIAEFKRKEQEKLTEEEKQKLHYEEIEKENQSLRRDASLNKRVADYVAIGYDADLAKKIAEAELDGKSTASFHKEHMDKEAEKIKADIMKNNGNNVHTGGGDNPVTKEQFNKMSYEERLKLHDEQPQVYAQLVENKQ